jgi:hypothetical protein
MKTVTLTTTEAANFFAGSDGAYYTPVGGVEARCRWCRNWGHHAGLYHREVLYKRGASLVCGRHIKWEEWLGAS